MQYANIFDEVNYVLFGGFMYFIELDWIGMDRIESDWIRSNHKLGEGSVTTVCKVQQFHQNNFDAHDNGRLGLNMSWKIEQMKLKKYNF
jgi:hypothetical protein